MAADFPRCSNCGADDWHIVFAGDIRAGAPGSWAPAKVGRCGDCGVDRLQESKALSHDAYQDETYRAFLEQNHDVEAHYRAHDELAKFALDALWPASLRGKIVADVGCGGGALLDHLSGLAETLIAIEPARGWADSLQARGYAWHPDAADAASQWGGRVDVVFSTQVIEHVEDPCRFLADIGAMLAADGIAIVTTPNRDDILMELLPDSFPAFFYRVQHRWAYDGQSLLRCARQAGLDAEVRYTHRYGLANTMRWLKEGRPRGRQPMAPLDSVIDRHWQAWLEQSGRADNLTMICRRAKTDR